MLDVCEAALQRSAMSSRQGLFCNIAGDDATTESVVAKFDFHMSFGSPQQQTGFVEYGWVDVSVQHIVEPMRVGISSNLPIKVSKVRLCRQPCASVAHWLISIPGVGPSTPRRSGPRQGGS